VATIIRFQYNYNTCHNDYCGNYKYGSSTFSTHLRKTQMIGILKSLGATNWTVRKIFLYNAFYLIVRGLLWGNILGIGLVLIQHYFGIIKLNPENYYVSIAPVSINWFHILLLNVGTIVICLLVLLIPSYIITKISPVKAIKFN